ncbi:5-formyltetrahydrofolate cyclo-ligase [Pradoshia sp. D12]|uniref:5-formyltetrahydrofolate cyclo-ligase n=1 Tax=Bacillaceae TaxID=186817 RepID=UPI00080AFAA9|nr:MULTISPECIES: 5-formyltetrahydrofolate cyclo-ligase [Bacillaceae]OCA86394.1 5-formyltetrahydrofolate cyclo-ligase [Bacillus sp. FJAT-27986]QFK72193.1 5-formyltetrahydrofolate cyclo-ligase [Pradoshia sp. D12]TPF71314.1 5-formyltetrahydrofolate cyclo-ligase [Bacillus sp. D12]
MLKGELRSTYRSLLAEFPSYERDTYTSKIVEYLFSHDIWKNAKTIGITISRHPEIETKEIIERAWKEKKNIVIPKCYPHTKHMEFYDYRPNTILESVYSGLKEPRPDKTQKIESDQIDIMVVPGLLFSTTGYRIGFGGGYYDRYLASFYGIKLSLAFMMQIRDDIHTEEFDIPVDYLFTEQGVINCG